jgi:membrane protein YqaA with SNARE-associated domain
MAYLSLFAWSFLAASIVPLGSEPILVALIARGHSLWTSVAVATAGNCLGAFTTYWLGGRAAALLAKSGRPPVTNTRAARLIQRYGHPAMLLSWVPVLGDAMVAAAGAVRMPFVPFAIYMGIGKAARYLLVAWGAASVW